MSQIKAPIHSYINLIICHKFKTDLSVDKFGNFYLGSQTRYIDSERISRSTSFNYLNGSSKQALAENNERHLLMQPSYAMTGNPNLSSKKNLSNIEYKILTKKI